MNTSRKRISRQLFLTLVSAIAMLSSFECEAQYSGNSRNQSPLNSVDTSVYQLDEVIISSSRADNKTPLTTSTLNRSELEQGKSEHSIPYLLNTQTSVEAIGENGSVGNTSMRIRGVDATRINVNINGITLNDPESQAVFWVNIPNLAGMAQSMQIQRGVGASNGGSAALGGAINMQTLGVASRAYGIADLSYGSWNTRQYGISAGTGMMKGGFSLDFAYNGLTSDGFVRGGATDQQSLFVSAGWYGERSLLKAVAIIGAQTTGISWNGADSATLVDNPTYNSCGEYNDALGNVRYYDNENDVYRQQHYQLYYAFFPNHNWTLTAALDYTHGYGYDERYKYNKKTSDYRMQSMLAVSRTDLILQKAMLNNAYTETFTARYQSGRLSLTLGEMVLLFDGDHYGDVLWTMDSSAVRETGDPYRWYSNTGKKQDATAFAKFNYEFSSRSNLYADLQFRYVHYTLDGTDDDYDSLIYNSTNPFFNPKVGWNYLLSNDQRIYAVAGLSNREPARSDIKDAVNNGHDIRPERMLDVELGYALQKQDLFAHANAYFMYYKDQLCPSGRQSNSGYNLMENIDKSYRLGLELEAGYRFNQWFDLAGNVTLSTNKAIDYKYRLNDGYTDTTILCGTTTLALSPSVIGSLVASLHPTKDWTVQLIGKYVGKEYCDNTGSEALVQQAYGLLNFRTSYNCKLSHGNELELQLSVNNLLDKQYMTHASCGDWVNSDGSRGTWHYFFMQPGRNFTLRAILKI